MTRPNTMQGVYLTGHGGPEKLVWNARIPVPELGPDDALVEVKAAGVNNTDINTRIGWYAKQVTAATDKVSEESDVEDGGWSGALNFPLIQGGDLCGRVVALGSAVGGTLAIGARVICPTNQPNPTIDAPTRFIAIGSEFDGAFAQYCRVPADQLYDVSASPLSDVELAALPCAHGTAHNLLCRAQVTGKDAVLITGASGGVGLALVELAMQRGAHVTAVTSENKEQAVRSAGADQILFRSDIPEMVRYDAVIDIVGGVGFGALLDALKPGGRYATSGAIAGPIVETDLRTVYLNDLTLLGCSYQSPEIFGDLVGLINTGKIAPLISKTYPLQDIALAQADFQSKRYPGKLVLIPPTLEPT